MRIDHQQWPHQHQKQKSVHPYHLSILLANKADIIVKCKKSLLGRKTFNENSVVFSVNIYKMCFFGCLPTEKDINLLQPCNWQPLAANCVK